MKSMSDTGVFIVAGGFGTRIKDLHPDVPKALIDVAGTPVIIRQINQLLDQGYQNISVIGGYKGELLRDHLRRLYGQDINYIQEATPLGTAGALSLVRPRVRESNLIISGDLAFEFCFDNLLNFHRSKEAVITLTTHPNNHPRDSDIVIEEPLSKRILEIATRPHPESFLYSNLVNASISVLDKRVWKNIKDGVPANLERDLIQKYISAEDRVYSYRTSEYIADMGTPERWNRVQKDFAHGLAQKKSLKYQQKAIFLDRDGVLNKYRGHLIKSYELELEIGAFEAIQKINHSEYLAIVITNQPQAAKGMCSIDDIYEINKTLETRLGDQGLKIDDIFVCLHHPEAGHPGENISLKVPCECRKPGIGMIKQAAEKYNIDLSASFIVGDSTSDILAGKRAGLKTILVGTGLAGKDRKCEVAPDYETKNILTAVNLILNA